MGTKDNYLAEIKSSVIDWKTALKTMGKDFLSLSFAIAVFILYYAIIMKSMPVNPGITQQNIFLTPQSVIDMTADELNQFYILIILGAMVGLLLIFAALTFIKEWIWAGIQKIKISYKSLGKLSGSTLLIYSIATIFFLGMMIISGLLFRQMIYAGASQTLTQIMAFLILIILVPVFLQLINFHSYTFIKTRSFVSSITEPFKSFAKTKQLLLPYIFILIALAILGTASNLFTKTGNNMVLRIIGLIIALYFIAWQRIYSNRVFDRIYSK